MIFEARPRCQFESVWRSERRRRFSLDGRYAAKHRQSGFRCSLALAIALYPTDREVFRHYVRHVIAEISFESRRYIISDNSDLRCHVKSVFDIISWFSFKRIPVCEVKKTGKINI